jgi:hypothetical protein
MISLQPISKGKLTPLQQVFFIVAIQMAFVFFFLIAGVKGRNVWMVLQGPVLFYTCMTLMMGIFNQNSKWYYLFSVLGYAAVMSVSVILSTFVSGDRLNKHGDFMNVLMLNTLFYFMMLIISVLYKGIKEFLENME